MTRVAVFHEPAGPECMPYRAVAGRNQARGRTAGEALDALASQLTQEEADTFVIIRSMSADQFFSAEQRRRFEELTAQLRGPRSKLTIECRRTGRAGTPG